MTQRIKALIFALAACGSSPWAFAGSFPASSVENGGQQVVFIEDKNNELQDAVANPGADSQDLHSMAQRLFDRVSENTAAEIPALSLRGWEKPSRKTEENVDGIMRSVAKGLETGDVPSPVRSRLAQAYVQGDAMLRERKMGYDENGELNAGQAGAYVYNERSAIGIIFNKSALAVQRLVGDEFAAATAVHESAHARDDAEGKLSPIEVKKGEKTAFETEYWWLKLIDPSGEKLSWARATIGKFASGKLKGPEYVADYLEHLASVRDYGDKGDFDGLVDSLGYKDRTVNPFHPQEKPAPLPR